MRLLVIAALCFPLMAFSQERAETSELVGRIGSRNALLMLHAAQRSDGGWRLTGEYVLLPTLARRYLQGERSPELGITTLKEGTTPILFGHDATGELRGTWRGGVFKGTRHGPGGQQREHFEFSEEFPPMEGYSAAVRCQVGDQAHESLLAYTVEEGKLKSFEWRSGSCTLPALEQSPMKGGLRFVSGDCAVTLREIGDAVKVAAEGCSAQCGARAQLEPLLVDRRGNCRLLLGEAR